MSTPEDHRSGPRKRGEQLHHAIVTAAGREIADHGVDGISMQRIATSAHTSKASIYRRWNSSEDLALDALYASLPVVTDAPDTGSTRKDLEEFLVETADNLSSPAARPLISAAVRRPSFMVAARDRLLDSRVDAVLTILSRGVDRGDVRTEAVDQTVAATGLALIMQHFLVHDAPMDRNDVRHVVDAVVWPLVTRC